MLFPFQTAAPTGNWDLACLGSPGQEDRRVIEEWRGATVWLFIFLSNAGLILAANSQWARERNTYDIYYVL